MIETSMIILCVVMTFGGFLTGWLVGSYRRVGCQQVHLKATTPIDKAQEVPDEVPMVACYSIEEHLKVVNYIHRVLLSEEERIRDGFRGAYPKTD